MPIRPWRPADTVAIAELFHASVRMLGPRRYSAGQVEAWSPAVRELGWWQAVLGDGRTVLVGVDEADRVLAFADLEADGHVDRLFRHPDASPGLAAALLDAIIVSAEGQGMARLYTEASDLARGLFERKGFEVVARRAFDLRGVMIWNWAMARDLGPPAGAPPPVG